MCEDLGISEAELDEMCKKHDLTEEDIMDEGFGDWVKKGMQKVADFSGENREVARKAEMKKTVLALKRLGYAPSEDEIEAVWQQAKADNFGGTITGDKNTKKLVYLGGSEDTGQRSNVVTGA